MSAAADTTAGMGKVKDNKPALSVWTFEVPAAARNAGFGLLLPKDAKVLGVRRGPRSGVVDVLVNPRMASESRYFWVAKTNFPLPDPGPEYQGLLYVGSYQGYGETWHVFEVQGGGKVEREPGAEG